MKDETKMKVVIAVVASAVVIGVAIVYRLLGWF